MGAGTHMTPNKSAFDNYIAASSSVTVADNNKCNIKGIRDLTLPDLEIKIENVHHILDLEFNLMSMGYLRHQEFKIKYDYIDNCFII